ncbi:MAG: DNA translocase FtsK [Bacteroidaceae bacterium]|nr:DNA translocase FtsK [Bacteroidaceae bacterium]
MAKKQLNKKESTLYLYFSAIKEFMRNDSTLFVIGLILALLGLYLGYSMYSYFRTGGTDQQYMDAAYLLQEGHKASNVGGTIGAQLADLFIHKSFGVASFFIPFLLLLGGISCMRIYSVKFGKWLICCLLIMFWSSITLSFLFEQATSNLFFYIGGQHGHIINLWLIKQIGIPGELLLLIGTAIVFGALLNNRVILFIRKIFHPTLPKWNIKWPKRKPKMSKEEKAMAAVTSEEGLETQDIMAEEKKEKEISEKLIDLEMENAASIGDNFIEDLANIPTEETTEEEEEKEERTEICFEDPSAEKYQNKKTETTAPLGSTKKDLSMQVEKGQDSEEAGTPGAKEPEFIAKAGGTEEDQAYEGPEIQPYNPKLDLENYHYPTIDLLKHYDDSEPTINMEEQNNNKNQIITVLRSFGIEISSIKATVGPTITLYEIKPESGIRISKIRGLEDDIALSLKAIGIRIIAPIPGKGTIGIEVPNSDAKIVSMQSVIQSKKFQESTFALPIAFGRTITNDVFMVDLSSMPHILVAGATGQGKSVGLNAIITSLLYKKHPAELKFVLIDPKKVEFSIYSVIEKHFLAKLPDEQDAIITDVKKVIQTLNSICVEMDSRYDLLQKAHVRNVTEYNKKFINRQLNPNKGHKFMPYIVVIIDEFGDLIMTAGKEIELPIARIAQLARAVGIHMVIATQRPTTNIITGTIKANFPARVAFKVSQMIDSRTILDRPGANQLIGRGDMLFLQGSNPVRVQCAFVSTSEVDTITNYISRQQGYSLAFELPEYTMEQKDEANTTYDTGKQDSLFEEVATLIVATQQASASMLQRKFSIGFNRAGRLIEQMEQAGIVGPPDGSKPRKVLCLSEMELESKLNNR